MLAGAEKVARAAELQVLFRDGEAVARGGHDLETLLVFLTLVVGDKDAVGLVPAAADAAAQLVELGEAEALGVFNQHERGVRHVDADLDDGGGDEHVDLMRGESAHDGVLFLRLHLAVDGGDAKVGEDLFLQHFRVGGDGLALIGELVVFRDHGADDIGLTALGDELAQKSVDTLVIARRDGKGVNLLPSGGELI